MSDLMVTLSSDKNRIYNLEWTIDSNQLRPGMKLLSIAPIMTSSFIKSTREISLTLGEFPDKMAISQDSLGDRHSYPSNGHLDYS